MMPRLHRYEPIREVLELGDVDDELGEQLLQLRDLSNAIAEAYRARDTYLLQLADTGRLTRRDLGRASGMAESRVNQIVRELHATQREEQARAKRAAAGGLAGPPQS